MSNSQTHPRDLQELSGVMCSVQKALYLCSEMQHLPAVCSSLGSTVRKNKLSLRSRDAERERRRGQVRLGQFPDASHKVLGPLGSDSHPSPAPRLPGSLPGGKPCVLCSFISAQPGCAGRIPEANPTLGPGDIVWRPQQRCAGGGGHTALRGFQHRPRSLSSV